MTVNILTPGVRGFFLGPGIGLATQGFLRRYEPSSILGFILIPASVGLLSYTLLSSKVDEAFASTLGFLFVISISVLYYRNFSTAHPLHHIPGPCIARSTQLWQFYQLYRGRPRVYQQQLHAKYGLVVRIGPNEVSIADASMLNVVFGGKPWLKGKSYSFTASGGAATAETSLSSIRDHKEHTFRRKIWDRAFSIASLKNYQSSIALRVQQLCDQLDSVSSKGPLELQEWIHYLVFDIMTDLAWGGGGDATLRGHDPDGAIASLRYSLHLAGMTKALPWFANILNSFPWVNRKTLMFRTFAKQMFLRRQGRGSENEIKGGRDVFYHLLGEGSEEGRQLSINALQADSRQVVTGGADTTVSAITYLFFHLACSPHYYTRLQAALDQLPRDEADTFNHDTLAKLPLLEAYINEALRLQPPIPYQNQRVVPEPGCTVAGLYLPPGTQVRSALYAIARDPANFSQPDAFRPERWLAEEREVAAAGLGVFNAKASIPFLLGPYHCVGRNFAMQEMRYTVATLVGRYDMTIVEGFDRKRFEGLVQDRSVLEIEGELNVVVRKREG